MTLQEGAAWPFQGAGRVAAQQQLLAGVRAKGLPLVAAIGAHQVKATQVQQGQQLLRKVHPQLEFQRLLPARLGP